MAVKKETIIIKPVEMETVPIRIVGETPLIVQKWSFKAMRELIDKGELKKKVPRNPVAQVAACSYWIDEEKDPFPNMPFDMIDGGMAIYESLIEKFKSYTKEDFERDGENARFGFPVTGIKKAALSAAYRNEMSKDKVSMQGAFFLMGEGENQLVEIKSDFPSVRQDFVKVGMGTADVHYRPQYENWHIDFELRYNKNGKLKLKDIINIINLGGQTNGIGEWRIEKGGIYGTYHVENI